MSGPNSGPSGTESVDSDCSVPRPVSELKTQLLLSIQASGSGAVQELEAALGELILTYASMTVRSQCSLFDAMR
jgi:hypothetical protein